MEIRFKIEYEGSEIEEEDGNERLYGVELGNGKLSRMSKAVHAYTRRKVTIKSLVASNRRNRRNVFSQHG